jgi:quinol monooxygenase YgiN
MVKVGLFVRLHAKTGKEAEVEQLLKSGLAIVQDEAGTPLWFALRFDASTFGIFDAFPDDAARQAHLGGASRRRSWPRPETCWRSRRPSRKSTCSPRRRDRQSTRSLPQKRNVE